MKVWLLFFSHQIEVQLSHSKMCNACIQNESVNCSGPIYCTATCAIQEKDDTLDWSGTHWNTVNENYNLQYAPKVHLSYSMHLCSVYSLHHILYPSKDSFNYSSEKIHYILYTFTSTIEKGFITPSAKSFYLSRLKHHNCKENTRQQFKLQLLDSNSQTYIANEQWEVWD